MLPGEYGEITGFSVLPSVQNVNKKHYAKLWIFLLM